MNNQTLESTGPLEPSVVTSAGTAAMAAKPSAMPDWSALVRTKSFQLGVLVVGALVLCFWDLMKKLPAIWMGSDGYYSHGFLVPLIAGYIVYRWWPRLERIPAKPGWFALVLLLPVLYLARAASMTDITQLASVTFVAAVILSVWFVGGFRWALALTPPALYLFFMLPIWTGAIDIYTNPLQQLSTKVAYELLKVSGFNPFQSDTTTIYLARFTLDVGVPCSGLKLVLAVTAFTAFFIMIGGLKWWANGLLVGLVLPLCLFINGLRIALIGMVGDTYGQDAGHQFHDYSGYITLVLCFFILFKVVRLLGWKD